MSIVIAAVSATACISAAAGAWYWLQASRVQIVPTWARYGGCEPGVSSHGDWIAGQLEASIASAHLNRIAAIWTGRVSRSFRVGHHPWSISMTNPFEAMDMTPADALSAVGRYLFGEKFKAPLAHALRVSVDRIDDWTKSRGNPPAPGVWDDLFQLVGQKANESSRILSIVNAKIQENKSYLSRDGRQLYVPSGPARR